MHAFAQYLQHYAEPEARLAQHLPAQFDSVLVLPSFDEPTESISVLLHHSFENRALIILVLNQAEDVSECTNNQKLQKTLLTQFTNTWHTDDGALALFEKDGRYVLLVDRFSKARKIPRKLGVGMARKIGADIALLLISQGKIRSPWIHNIDADCVLPTPYVTLCEQLSKETAAAVLPFRHIPCENAELNLAQAIYDRHMHYYVAGLSWAASPYAYHSLGSTIIISAQHYAQVRGFPKRSAGEDFHLLNKLRKSGHITSLTEPVMTLQTRASHRTPFGTGAAISEISRLADPENDYRFYHPHIFNDLRTFLAFIPDLFRHKKRALNSLPAHTQRLLNDLTISKAVQHANDNSTTEEGFIKHMHTWFDALKTLQFVHGLRDSVYPSVSATELDRLLPFDLEA